MTITFVFSLAILIMSVVIHEVAHGYAAEALGDSTARLQGRLTLNPLAHLDWFGSVILPLMLSLLPGGLVFGWAKPVPYNPYNLRGGKWGPALVAAAGPASNLFLMAFFALFLRLFAWSGPVIYLASSIVLVNLALAIFNLIPVPPLDGSKILFAILPYRLRSLENFLTTYSLFFVFLLLFVLWDFISPLVFTIFTWLVG
ncbi:MAG: site-2 protease family protein [Patescibacteria group bacterium]